MGKKKKSKDRKPNKSTKSKENKNDEESKVTPPNFKWEYLTGKAPQPLPDSENEKKLQLWSKILTQNIDSEYHELLQAELRDAVYQTATLLNTKQQEEYFGFLDSNENVQTMNENWKITSFQGFGFKVSSKKRCEPDDKIYLKNPILQELVPRGIVFAKNDKGEEPKVVLFSNRKFFGRKKGDDDDSDLCSKKMERGEYSHFLISTKSNGENCQITLLDKKNWIVGSKNRKIVVSKSGDIELYKEDMYQFAVEMAESFFSTLEKMGKEKEEQLRELLALTSWTMNFEFESTKHQHVVPLYEDKLVLINLTGVHLRAKNMHPIFTKAVGDYFNFSHVLPNTTTYPKSEVDAKCQEIVYGWNYEGAVLVLLNEKKEVVDLVKVKTWWYVLLRAIREKVRRVKETTDQETIQKLKKRLKELKTSMTISEEYIEIFTNLGSKFVEWIIEPGKNRMDLFKEKYPILWLDFLKENNLPLDQKLINFISNKQEMDSEK